MPTNVQKSLPYNAPARFGCYLGLAVAAAGLLYAMQMLFTGSDHMMPYKLAFLTGGIVQGVTCLKALWGSRAAWSYALAINGTLALAFVFGAPQVRDGWDVPLWAGFLPATVFAVTTLLLSRSPEQY